MATLTMIQLVQIFAIYLFVMVFLPVLAFGNKLQRFSFALRMMAYFAIGNFFVINLVLYLQLLHISYRPTLILGTLAFYGFFTLRNRKLDIKALFYYLIEMMDRRHNRRVGRKTFWRIMAQKTKRFRIAVTRWLWEYVVCHIPEWMAAVGLVALIWYLFGGSFLDNYGYAASDIPVHNYWINELSKDNLFCAGIYPFGMHTQVYYLHQVFGIETYVLLRLWGLISVFGLCGGLLGFLGWLCKSKTLLPFLGVYLYIAPTLILEDMWKRFYSALPQEYGMVFILPAMAFLFAYFEERSQGETEDFAKLNLFFFALYLSLSISIHFYPAISTLVLCLGCGIGYLRKIFSKEYFFLILKTGLYAFSLAALPMMIAFAGGTPFQGSMGWALGVMKNGGSGDDGTKQQKIIVSEMEEGDTPVYGGNGVIIGYLKPGESLEDFVARTDGGNTQYVTEEEAESQRGGFRLFQKVKGRVISLAGWAHDFPHNLCILIETYILSEDYQGSHVSQWFLWLFVITIGLSVLLRFVNANDGRILCSIGLGYLFLLILVSANQLHLPVIMDATRGRYFFYYTVPVALIAVLNAILRLLEAWHHNPRISRDISVIVALSIATVVFIGNLVRGPLEVRSLEYPGAMTSLTNIVENSKPFTYTIVSANDELRMVEDVGFHYEIISLLRHLALYRGGDYEKGEIDDLTEVDKGHLYIPTEDIYVFIELVPQNYYGTYAGSGQRISEEGAAMTLPSTNSFSVYYTENRWICMSKTYYWMEAFRELHPDAVSVYYQDSDFICYRIHQNPFSLYDLCIDYGYNHCGETNITVND